MDGLIDGWMLVWKGGGGGKGFLRMMDGGLLLSVVGSELAVVMGWHAHAHMARICIDRPPTNPWHAPDAAAGGLNTDVKTMASVWELIGPGRADPPDLFEFDIWVDVMKEGELEEEGGSIPDDQRGGGGGDRRIGPDYIQVYHPPRVSSIYTISTTPSIALAHQPPRIGPLCTHVGQPNRPRPYSPPTRAPRRRRGG
jgi:hypothetical protein